MPAGSAAVFPCMASGYPTPVITWSKVCAGQGPKLSHWRVDPRQVEERLCGGAAQGMGAKFGCFCSWMVTCPLAAAWRTTCWCCPQSGPKTQAPMSALPPIIRARSKPSPTYRCQVRPPSPRTGNALPAPRGYHLSLSSLPAERVVPYFTQTPRSFLTLPTIKDAYRKFEIKITFRPDSADGEQAEGG